MATSKNQKTKSSAPSKSTQTKKNVSTSEYAMKKIFITLLLVLIVYLIVFLGTYIRNNIRAYKYIGEQETPVRTITVSADADVTVRPDTATIVLGLVTEGETVAAAQEKNSQTINALFARLLELDIAKEDVKTNNYNIYPDYSYTDNERALRAYVVNQDILVKIRDLEHAEDVLALAGELELNTVSGLTFSVENPDAFIDAAREKALKNVLQKADALSQALGVRFTKVLSYEEHTPENSFLPFAMRNSGIGGAEFVPNVEAGTQQVSINVQVIFEIE